MIRKLLEKWAASLPIRPIYHGDKLYLKRYHVAILPSWLGSWRIYLHHIVGNDPDGLHNHPWRYGFSIILAGFYIEDRRYCIRQVKWFNLVNCDTLHRVRIYRNRDCWSLFCHSPRICSWGFLRQDIGDTYQYKDVSKRLPTPVSSWHAVAPVGRVWENDSVLRKHLHAYLGKYLDE